MTKQVSALGEKPEGEVEAPKAKAAQLKPRSAPAKTPSDKVLNKMAEDGDLGEIRTVGNGRTKLFVKVN